MTYNSPYEAESRIVEDSVRDGGPVAGIRDSLRACHTEYTAVVACDNPLVDPAFVAYLFRRTGGWTGAVPRVDGRLQPTQAVYRTDAMRSACRSASSARNRSLLAVLDEIDPVVVPETEVRARTGRESFADVNTPGDLQRIVGRRVSR